MGPITGVDNSAGARQSVSAPHRGFWSRNMTWDQWVLGIILSAVILELLALVIYLTG